MSKVRSKKRWKKEKRRGEHEQGLLYRMIRKLVQIFTPNMKTVWETPYAGRPSVFVCNHDRAFGPIAMCAHFERFGEIRPWINSQVLSAKMAPSYIRSDYWWNPDKWYSPILEKTLAYLYALILPPILRGSDCIPVYHDTSVMSTLKQSIKYLRDGKDILLFPEQPTEFGSYDEKIMDGFVSIGRLFYARTKGTVDFYPGYIDWKRHIIYIGMPFAYDGTKGYEEQSASISKTVEEFFARHNQKP